MTAPLPRPLRLVRGFSTRGIGEGAGVSIDFGEQYLYADAALAEDGRFLQALRPWMVLDASPGRRVEPGQRLGAWSVLTRNGWTVVARLCAAPDFDNRTAYFSQAWVWSTKAPVDPGLLCGRPDAFEAPWRTDAPAVRLPDLSGAAWLGAVSADRPSTIRLLARLLAACLQGHLLVVVVPESSAFALTAPIVHQLAFARAALPPALREHCDLRIYTEKPARFVRSPSARVLVVGEDCVQSTLREARLVDLPVVLIDGRGAPLLKDTAELPTVLTDYATGLVQTLTANADLAPHLPDLMQRIGHLSREAAGVDWWRTSTPQRLINSLEPMAYLAWADGRREDLDSLLTGYLLPNVDAVPGAERFLPWSELLSPPEVKALSDTALTQTILTAPGGRGEAGLRHWSVGEARRRGLRLGRLAVTTALQALPPGERVGVLLDLVDAELFSETDAATISAGVHLSALPADGRRARLLAMEAKAGLLGNRSADPMAMAALARGDAELARNLLLRSAEGALDAAWIREWAVDHPQPLRALTPLTFAFRQQSPPPSPAVAQAFVHLTRAAVQQLLDSRGSATGGLLPADPVEVGDLADLATHATAFPNPPDAAGLADRLNHAELLEALPTRRGRGRWEEIRRSLPRSLPTADVTVLLRYALDPRRSIPDSSLLYINGSWRSQSEWGPIAPLISAHATAILDDSNAIAGIPTPLLIDLWAQHYQSRAIVDRVFRALDARIIGPDGLAVAGHLVERLAWAQWRRDPRRPAEHLVAISLAWLRGAGHAPGRFEQELTRSQEDWDEVVQDLRDYTFTAGKLRELLDDWRRGIPWVAGIEAQQLDTILAWAPDGSALLTLDKGLSAVGRLPAGLRLRDAVNLAARRLSERGDWMAQLHAAPEGERPLATMERILQSTYANLGEDAWALLGEKLPPLVKQGLYPAPADSSILRWIEILESLSCHRAGGRASDAFLRGVDGAIQALGRALAGNRPRNCLSADAAQRIVQLIARRATDAWAEGRGEEVRNVIRTLQALVESLLEEACRPPNTSDVPPLARTLDSALRGHVPGWDQAQLLPQRFDDSRGSLWTARFANEGLIQLSTFLRPQRKAGLLESPRGRRIRPLSEILSACKFALRRAEGGDPAWGELSDAIIAWEEDRQDSRPPPTDQLFAQLGLGPGPTEKEGAGPAVVRFLLQRLDRKRLRPFLFLQPRNKRQFQFRCPAFVLWTHGQTHVSPDDRKRFVQAINGGQAHVFTTNPPFEEALDQTVQALSPNLASADSTRPVLSESVHSLPPRNPGRR
jgi:hypothetical protein